MNLHVAVFLSSSFLGILWTNLRTVAPRWRASSIGKNAALVIAGGLGLYTGKPEHFMNIDNVVTSHNKDQDKQTVQKSQTNL